MCGIAGYVGERHPDERLDAVVRMTSSLERRGPDDHGIEQWPSAVLGHRRLSIFDLSASGHQPMLSDTREAGIVFNGAIYNFRELRTDLEQTGHTFKSETDTEVLLKGYLEWGIDRLAEKIDGMFAFAIWDERSKRLFLVRDRLGVKPLVFFPAEGSLAFASTVRALRAVLPKPEISNEGLVEFLEFGFLTDRTAIYRGIEKVRAGEIVEWADHGLSKRSYWTPKFDRPFGNISFAEACEETEQLFVSAVKKRLQADVPVAALLSGGIDSSLVCWAIAELGSSVKAYTVGTPGEEYDESVPAKETAARLGIDLTVLPLERDGLPDPKMLAEAFSEPFACSSALGMLSIAELVSKNAKVLLTGDGGDDVFLGYPEHRHFQMASRVARRAPASALRFLDHTKNVLPNSGRGKRIRSFSSYTAGGLAALAAVRDGLPFYHRNKLFGRRFEQYAIDYDEGLALPDSGASLLEDFLAYDLRTRFVGEYLPKVDGSTMSHGLEARSPFLDSALWDYATRIPPEVRLRGGELKAILREIVRRRIGPEVANRKKQGFMIPAQRWLTDEWRPLFIDSISTGHLAREGIIDAEAVISQFELLKAGDLAPRQFWYMFTLEMWMRYESELRAV